MSPAVQKRPLGDLHANGPSPREERVEATPRRLTQGATARLGDLALLRSILLRMVRKMSLPLPQSRRTYAGSRSWSLDRHQRPMHVLRSRCHGSVPFDPASPLRKERMVRTVPRGRASSLAATIADFCNKIGTKRTCRDVCYLSAFGGKTDILLRSSFSLLTQTAHQRPVFAAMHSGDRDRS